MKRFVLAAACGVALAGGLAVAQGVETADSSAAARSDKQNAKRPMTFADLMAMKRVSDPQVSPSGKWVMFSVTEVSLEKNTKVNHLWVVPLKGGGGTEADSSAALRNDKQELATAKTNTEILSGAQNDAADRNEAAGRSGERQVTAGAGESFGRFSPDGKWVSMTIGDDVYLAPWDEAAGTVGEPKPLTHVSGGGADGAVWSPDSKRLMFTAMVWPECSVKGGTAALERQEPFDGKAVIGGSLVVPAWKTGEPAGWAEEDACDRAKDEAQAKSPVKGQIFDGLLYRHWDHWTGEKRTHILVVNADGSGTRDLTPANEVGDAETPTWMLGGPQEYAWAPDSKEIAYVTNLDAVPAASTNNDVFTLRLDEAGAKAVKVSTSPGSDDEPEYSPNGKWLAFRSQARGGFESDKFRLVLYDRSGPGASGEGQKGKPAVSDKLSAISELMPGFDLWVDEFSWSKESEGIFYVTGKDGEENIDFLGVLPSGESGNQIGFLEGEGEFSDVHPLSHAGSPDGGAILVASRMTAGKPSEIVILPKRHKAGTSEWGGEEAITHVNDWLLHQLDLPKLEPFWFVGAEGTKVEGFLLKPPGFDPAKKYPVKFLMHGGPQTAWGDAWSYRWNWELMAASGYVVIGINRRGSTGYGQKFVDEVSGDWGGRAYEDLMKGLDYAEATYPFIDKNRECALGASYGGFMANWVLTHTNRFKCIVTHDGMYDPASAWGATEEMWFNEWEFRRPEDFPKGWDGFSEAYDPMGGRKADSSAALRNDNEKALRNDKREQGSDKQGQAAAKATTGILRSAQNDTSIKDGAGHVAEPWRYQDLPAGQDPFRRWSPARFIANAKTPTLIIHSQKDMRLDVSQGFELFTALQRLGVPSKMLYFPDEGHWVLKPQNAELWNAMVSDWCDRWTHTGKYAHSVVSSQ